VARGAQVSRRSVEVNVKVEVGVDVPVKVKVKVKVQVKVKVHCALGNAGASWYARGSHPRSEPREEADRRNSPDRRVRGQARPYRDDHHHDARTTPKAVRIDAQSSPALQWVRMVSPSFMRTEPFLPIFVVIGCVFVRDFLRFFNDYGFDFLDAARNFFCPAKDAVYAPKQVNSRGPLPLDNCTCSFQF